MSTRVECTYPLAPISVDPDVGRRLDFEVDRDGLVCLTAEVDDLSGWSGPRTAEVYFNMSAEDWKAVVEHIRRDMENTDA